MSDCRRSLCFLVALCWVSLATGCPGCSSPEPFDGGMRDGGDDGGMRDAGDSGDGGEGYGRPDGGNPDGGCWALAAYSDCSSRCDQSLAAFGGLFYSPVNNCQGPPYACACGIEGSTNLAAGCQVDSDCAVVTSDCCSCMYSGSSVAVLASTASTWAASVSVYCRSLRLNPPAEACPYDSSIPGCAQAGAICFNGTCSIAPTYGRPDGGSPIGGCWAVPAYSDCASRCDSHAAAIGNVPPTASDPCQGEPVACACGVAGSKDWAFQCASDADCALVNADCCGCSNGGSAMAVSGVSAAQFQSSLEEYCSGVGVGPGQTCHPGVVSTACIDAGVACVQGGCTVLVR